MTNYLRSILLIFRSGTARNAGLVLSGNIGSALLRFAVTMLLVKVLTKSEFAYFVVFVALMDITSTICDLGLNTTIVRFFAQDANADLRSLLKQSLVIRASLWGIASLIAVVGAFPFFSQFEIPAAYRPLYAAAVIAGVLLSFNGHGMAVMQAAERFRSYICIAVSNNVARLLFVGGCIWLGVTRADSLFLVFFLVSFLVLPIIIGFLLVTLRSRTESSVAPVSYEALVRFMLPVGGVILVTGFLARLDVFMLKLMSSAETLADYGLAYQLAFVFPLVTRALFTVLLPKAAGMTTSAQLKTYQEKILHVYPLVLLATVFGVVILPSVLVWLFGEKYASALPALRVLIVGFGLSIVFNPLTVILYSLKRHRYVLGIHMLQLPMLLGLNLFFIPQFGGLGAALSDAIMRLLGVVALLLVTRSVIREKAWSEEGSI